MAIMANTFAQFGATPNLLRADLGAEFIRTLPDRVKTLKTMLDALAWEEMGRYAYRFKKTATDAGFTQLIPLTARLEQATRGGEPEETIRQSAAQLIDACQRIGSESR